MNPPAVIAPVVDVRLGPDDDSLADDVLDGLTRPFKELPPKHLYDAVGAGLFDSICEQPEYYPTRCERAILAERAADIVARTGAAELVELGSGTAEKTRVLLDAMQDAGTLRRYVPFDVTEEMVRRTADEIAVTYPGCEVHGVVGDFERHLGAVPPPTGPRLFAFLGGTIGNFTPGARRSWLRDLASTLRPDDVLLLGTDLIKDVATVEAAYNDAAGVTAAFNRNVLEVVNRRLEANFVPEWFEHVAFYDFDREWIDLRLRSCRRHVVRVEALDLDLAFEAREEIRTEISTKFTPVRLEQDLTASCLRLDELYTDADDLFGVSLSRPIR